LSGLRLNEYAETARRFVWNELADWYVESVKPRLGTPGDDRDVARAVLVHAVDGALRLLHPVVPFITETLWQRLPTEDTRDAEYLARASWPSPTDRGEAVEFDRVRDAITAIRQIRADYNVPPGTVVDAVIVPSVPDTYRDGSELIARLSRARVTVGMRPGGNTAAHAVLTDGSEVVVPLADLVDVRRECARLREELDQLVRHLTALEQRLEDQRFTSRAPAQVVEAERQKQRDWSARRGQLEQKVRTLCGS
jgi:valyl-tRNA synthetase